MKRIEFLKRLGLGLGAAIVAPKLLVSQNVTSTQKTPVKNNIGEVLEFPSGEIGFVKGGWGKFKLNDRVVSNRDYKEYLITEKCRLNKEYKAVPVILEDVYSVTIINESSWTLRERLCKEDVK